MKLLKTERYGAKERKFLRKHPELIDKYGAVLRKLSVDPFDRSLKLHSLKGNLSEFYAVSLTYEYKIVLFLKIVDGEIVLFNIGTHDEVY